MKLDEILENIQAIDEARDRSINLLAALVREIVVVPTCKKHGLKFLSVNGDWWFEIVKPTKKQMKDPHLTEGWAFIKDVQDAKEYGLESALEDVMARLRAPVQDWNIGCFIMSYCG